MREVSSMIGIAYLAFQTYHDFILQSRFKDTFAYDATILKSTEPFFDVLDSEASYRRSWSDRPFSQEIYNIGQ